jgi:hypothetical protein
MSAQAATIISGVVLLAVFVLVGWNLRRVAARRSEGRAEKSGYEDSSDGT